MAVNMKADLERLRAELGLDDSYKGVVYTTDLEKSEDVAVGLTNDVDIQLTDLGLKLLRRS